MKIRSFQLCYALQSRYYRARTLAQNHWKWRSHTNRKLYRQLPTVVCNLSWWEISAYVTWFRGKKLEITKTRIDSVYGSIKSSFRSSALCVEEFSWDCWDFILRYAWRDIKQKKRLDGEKKIHAVLLSNNVFLELQHFEFAFLDSRHFLGTLNLGVSDHRCFMSFRLPGWTLSSKWKFPLMKNKSFGPLSSFAFLPIPFYGKKFV